MITNNNIKDLEKITSSLSFIDYVRDYKNSNRYKLGAFTPLGKQRKVTRTSLSSDTMEAYNILVLSSRKNISIEQETEIKRYLLNVKFDSRDLLNFDREVYFKSVIADR